MRRTIILITAIALFLTIALVAWANGHPIADQATHTGDHHTNEHGWVYDGTAPGVLLYHRAYCDHYYFILHDREELRFAKRSITSQGVGPFREYARRPQGKCD